MDHTLTLTESEWLLVSIAIQFAIDKGVRYKVPEYEALQQRFLAELAERMVASNNAPELVTT